MQQADVAKAGRAILPSSEDGLSPAHLSFSSARLYEIAFLAVAEENPTLRSRHLEHV